MSKSIKLQRDTYLDSCSIAHNKKPLNGMLNNLITYKEITGISLKGTDTYQLDLPKQTIFVEVFLYGYGTECSGGNFIVPGGGFAYLTNTDIHSGDYNGVYVVVNYNGLVSISNYRHCGADVTGFRIWYLNL